MPRSTYAMKVHDVSQFDAHVVSLAQPVGLSQDIGVRSTSAVETGRVNKVDFGFHIVIALVSGDRTRTYTQLECTHSSSLRVWPTGILSTKWEMNVLFPLPVTPITAITTSSGL
jgi:hypothetical protein